MSTPASILRTARTLTAGIAAAAVIVGGLVFGLPAYADEAVPDADAAETSVDVVTATEVEVEAPEEVPADAAPDADVPEADAEADAGDAATSEQADATAAVDATESAPVADAAQQEATQAAEGGAEPLDGADDATEVVAGTAAASFVGPLPALPAAVPTVVVSKTSGLSRDGETVTVSGTGFSGASIYVSVCDIADVSGLSFMFLASDSCISTRSAMLVKQGSNPDSAQQAEMGADGSFSFEFVVPAAAAGFANPAIVTARDHTGMSDRTQDTLTAISFQAAGDGGGNGDGGSGGETGGSDGGSGDGGSGDGGSGITAPSVTLSPSTVNPSVATTITVSGSGFAGVGAANGVYVSLGASSVWQPGQVPSEGGWVTTVWVTPASITGGAFTTTLTVPAGALVAGTDYGVATFAAHGLALTNRSLDTWTPIALSTASLAGTAATSTTVGEPAPTAPATSGIVVLDGGTTAGGTVTVTASGFQPNEQNVLVVIYSEPTLLGIVHADTAGEVTWSGRLPAALTGKHTLTFQGSVNRGVELDLEPAAIEGAQCEISEAELTWGFKESFRAYVSGTIANGEWTVADGAEYETPTFSWTGGGRYDPETGELDLDFAGSVRFTGHGGVMDTTIANPRVLVDGDGAQLLLDVAGTTQDGTPVAAVAVAFADLDLTGIQPTEDGGTVTWAEVPATLTAEGAAAFGTYPAGEALDAITLVVELPADCITAADPAEPTVEPTVISSEVVATDSNDVAWLWWLIGGLLVLTGIVVAVIVLARRRAS